MTIIDSHTDAGQSGACEPPKSVLGKASVILSAFGADHPRLTLADLVKRTGLPKSTAHRLAGFLVHEGWLEFRDGVYSVGIRLFELGGLVNDRQDLRESAIPFMQDLYEATHEIVHLAVLRERHVLYIDKIGGHRRMAVPSRIGGCMPAHATGLGKAMLACSSRDQVAAVIGAGLTRHTPYTITSPSVLLADLQATSRRGYAVDREESGVGVACAASAIVCRGVLMGAISVTGPTYRLDPERLAPAVRTAALGVARVLAAQS